MWKNFKMVLGVNKKVALWRIFMLSSVAAAINIGFSVLRSYGIPLILESGLHIKYATLVFAISPTMAFLLQGFLGTISDQCDCWWGRRRPFIVTFSVSACIGFFIAPFAFYFSNISKALVVTTVSACLVIGDFSIGVLQLPSRAYLLDVLTPSQSVRGNFFFSSLYGVGSAFGAFLGGINWSWITRQSLTIPHQGQLVYGLTAICIIVCMFLTICSVKEKPYVSDVVGSERLQINEALYYDEFEVESKQCSCLSCSRCFKAFYDPFVDIYRFISKMSYHMWLLWIMTFVSYFALIFFNSYLTLFVGTVVYNGDPDAPKNSDSYQHYVEGVHIGSWVLALAAIGNLVFSLLLSYTTKFIDIKTIYLVVTTLFTIGSCFLIHFHQLPLVFAVGFIFGLFYGLTLTVPFTLIPIYKERNLLFRKHHSVGDESVEGRACAVINTALFLAQIGAAFLSGPLLAGAGDYIYIMFFTCVMSSLSFLFTLFVNMPSMPKKQDNS